MSNIFRVEDLTVYSLADEDRVDIVCLPPEGSMNSRCERARKICLTKAEALDLADKLRWAAERL